MLVQKYGGATLATPEKITNLARSIAELHQQGESLIIVVSAMGKTTDELVQLAYRITSHPNRRELDMLLTTGERVSMALMSMALAHLGRPSISFTGSQAGVLTDASHSNAYIQDLRPFRVEEEMKKGKIVVLAGFQGVNPNTKEITTLGRGGSDTTAVAMAAHFKAKRCEILKDVAGVYSADPNKISSARRHSQLRYADLTEMCWWGAKVLHSRSADLAWKLNVPLFIGLATDRRQGTLIVEGDDQMYESTPVLALNTLLPVRRLNAEKLSAPQALKTLAEICDQSGNLFPKVLTSTVHSSQFSALIHLESNEMQNLETSLKNQPALSLSSEVWAAISVTGYSANHSSLMQKILNHLEEKSVTVHETVVSPRSFTLFVNNEVSQKVCEQLHCLLF